MVALRSGPEKDIPKEHRDHAWFVAYAPFEAPQIAVAVLVEHMGHGGSAAAPLAKDLIETFRAAPGRSIGDSTRGKPKDFCNRFPKKRHGQWLKGP